jgi:hypothetical protein
VTSTQTTTTGNQNDGDDDDEDVSQEGTDYSDEDEDEDEYDEFDFEPTPLTFLRAQPFPGLNLSIDGSPVAIVNTSNFDEDTDRENLTPAHAVSTILWNWHPNALRAFLDHKKYSAFEFAIVEERAGDREKITHMITRHDRAILIGDYDKDMEWNYQLSHDFLENGH